MQVKGTYALKLLLEVDEKAEAILDGQSKVCNWAYNRLLQVAQKLKVEFIQTKDLSLAKTVYSQRGLRDLLPGLKEAYPFLKVVHSSPLKNAALRLSDAVQAHQKSKKGKRKGAVVN